MAERNPQIAFLVWTRIFDLLRHVISALLYGWLAYMAYRAVDALSGKVTKADIDLVLAFFVSKQNDFGLPWLVAIVAVMWAILERGLRLKKTEALSNQNRILQEKLDPKRTSSGLLPTGETNPRDKHL